MKIDYKAFSGETHTPKFKVGDVVEHPNFGSTHTVTKILFNGGYIWYELGEGREEPEEALSLLSSSPPWDTMTPEVEMQRRVVLWRRGDDVVFEFEEFEINNLMAALRKANWAKRPPLPQSERDKAMVVSSAYEDNHD